MNEFKKAIISLKAIYQDIANKPVITEEDEEKMKAISMGIGAISKIWEKTNEVLDE